MQIFILSNTDRQQVTSWRMLEIASSTMIFLLFPKQKQLKPALLTAIQNVVKQPSRTVQDLFKLSVSYGEPSQRKSVKRYIETRSIFI